ncbi:FtsX-like permease family protein [Catenuloplanes japonicus]|uniref:FtsX-like permease family protein n=1 Tax=Catenuloplanes japonicus TaxID=33876 RepID=UPI00052531A7|nr:FtsX-like permease family protein [Catenuloplanes japonicus]
MNGPLLLAARLVLRGLGRRRAEAALLLIAVTAATTAMTIGLALDETVSRPYQRTWEATRGPDLVVDAAGTGPESLARMAEIAARPGVVAHAGPYPLIFKHLTAAGVTMRVVVQGRDTAPAEVDRPVVTDGDWIRPGGVVMERAFAEALAVRTGDTVVIDGHAMTVAGIAVGTARGTFPQSGWHEPGAVGTEKGGLVWADRDDLVTIAGEQQPSYTLNLLVGDGWTAPEISRGWSIRTAAEIGARYGSTNELAGTALRTGGWLLSVLAVTGVAGIVAGRIVAQRRRAGLLRAVGAGPGLIAGVLLAEYLVVGLAAAGLGLAIGWLAAPLLFRPTSGLLAPDGVTPPPLRLGLAAVGLALAIAVAGALAPIVRAGRPRAAPRRRTWRVRLSRRLPVSVLIGVRIHARRTGRGRLVTVNTLVTAAAFAAVLTHLAQADDPLRDGASTLPDPRNERLASALLVIAVLIGLLALLNTAVSTWAAVLDARHPLTVARALGATPVQAGLGLTVAQLLPALPGVVLGVPLGVLLYGGDKSAPGSWLLTGAVGLLVLVATLTAVPALLSARHPVADAFRATPATTEVAA